MILTSAGQKFVRHSALLLVVLLCNQNKNFLSSFLVSANAETGICAPIGDLGLDNLDRYDYSVKLNVAPDTDGSGSCDYTLDIKYKHDETLPLPGSPATDCDPSVQPPNIASDGLPYYAFRWAYESVSDRVKRVTGIDHISVDFNPCGHPPMGVFTVPHYDLHIYLVSPEYRTCMTCTTIPGAPVCDPSNQDTFSGRAFFNVATTTDGSPANMPDGFEVAVFDSVPLMGGHAWHAMNQPPGDNSWSEPVWVMGPYDGQIVDYEPMFPLSYVSGDTSTYWEENLTYKGQTIPELPNRYSVGYDADTKVITVSLSGTTSVCKKPKNAKGTKSSKSSSKSRK